ncbi:mechanosensitive ion channel family protein [Candidatus Omnitrophota bacterium]
MKFPKKIVSGIALGFVISLGSAFSAFAQEQAATTAVFASEIGTAKKVIDLFVEFCLKYSFQAIGGIIILVLGSIVAKFVAKFLHGVFEKHKVDVTVGKFAISMVKILIIAFAALIALGKFGITIAPFIAGLSVIGFGTSFALQGPLSNYAAGITLIFTKPFKVGDIIEVTGVVGEVQDMTLARTLVKALDGNLIVVPNKQILGEIIHNYSSFKKLDITVGVSYGADIDKAIGIVKNIVLNDKRVSQTPPPKVGISEFADSSINIYSRLWCKQEEYFDLMFDINKSILDEFNRQKITIPFPQRDVHIFNQKQ